MKICYSIIIFIIYIVFIKLINYADYPFLKYTRDKIGNLFIVPIFIINFLCKLC